MVQGSRSSYQDEVFDSIKLGLIDFERSGCYQEAVTFLEKAVCTYSDQPDFEPLLNKLFLEQIRILVTMGQTDTARRIADGLVYYVDQSRARTILTAFPHSQRPSTESQSKGATSIEAGKRESFTI